MSKEARTRTPNYPLRRRIAGMTAASLALVAANEGVKALASDDSAAKGPTTTISREYVATSGDTLFGIAEKAEPNSDPRQVSDNIEQAIAKRDGVSVEDATNIVPGEVIPLSGDAKIGQEIVTIHLPGVR